MRSGEPVAPAELRGAIRLVHPVELPPARLAALQARLGTQAQPFEQLGRQVLRVSPAERGSRWSSALAAEVVDDRVLHSDLARRGWRRGEIMDTGVFYELYTGALPGGWWAFISLDPGIAGNGPEGVAQRIVGVHFVRAREDRPGAIPFDFHAFWRREVAAGRRDRHRSVEAVLGVTLRSVPAVVFSEIMRVVGAAAGRARRALLTAPRDSTQP